MTKQFWQNDGVALAEQLRAGDFTPVDLLEKFIDRINQLNPTLNAVVFLSEQAIKDAKASAKRIADNKPLSLLDGLPILIKDNLIVKGMPNTWGCELYAHQIGSQDEIPIQKLREAGAVIVGKTNVPEFTVEGFTANKLFGTTVNPWQLSTTPGGSSGGSVAAVASGMIPLSVGTDGGGSIRRPAAYTNLVGMKTTLGRIPRGAGLPQLLLDMEVVGPLTRTVRDQAMLFDVLAQPDLRDHRSLQFAPANSMKTLFNAPKGLRVLAVEQFGDAPVDPDIRASFQQMIKVMKSLGHQVEEGELPLNIELLNQHWASIANISLAALLASKPEMRELASAKYIEWADTTYSATHLLNVIEIITELRNQASRVFDTLDIIMTPCCAAMPWPTDIDFPTEIDNQPVGPRGSAVYTGWVNGCGHPAISLPGKMNQHSMPIGIQFVGNFGEDELLLQLAQQIQDKQSWLEIWPTMAFMDKVSL